MVSVVEICAGAGGMALGFERAGIHHAALVEVDSYACDTLRANRPAWPVVEIDVCNFSGVPFAGVDVVAGGVPCQPFSRAGNQRGRNDKRDMFPQAIRIVGEIMPRMFVFENVVGLLGEQFGDYRAWIVQQFRDLGYWTLWQVINCADYGVPQNRRRVMLVGFLDELAFMSVQIPWRTHKTVSLGEALRDLVSADGWPGAADWCAFNNQPIDTLGTKMYTVEANTGMRFLEKFRITGPVIADKGPSRTLPADEPVSLTNRMYSRLMGFPDEWIFCGPKSVQRRQMGNAFPPAAAAVVAGALLDACAVFERVSR